MTDLYASRLGLCGIILRYRAARRSTWYVAYRAVTFADLALNGRTLFSSFVAFRRWLDRRISSGELSLEIAQYAAPEPLLDELAPLWERVSLNALKWECGMRARREGRHERARRT